MATQTIEIYSLPGLTGLTISLAAYGGAAYIESNLALTEDGTTLGIYRGSRTGTDAGAHTGLDSNGTMWHFKLANATATYRGQLLPIDATVGAIGTGGITSASFATDSITAAAVAADAITEIQSGLATSSSISTLSSAVAAVQADTDDIQTNIATAQTDITTIKGYTDDIGVAGAGLTALASASSLATVAANVSTAVSQTTAVAIRADVGLGAADLDTQLNSIYTVAGLVQAKTDNLPSDPADASDIATSFGTVNSTLATIAGYIDTEVAAIKAKTDNLPALPAAVGSAMTLTAAYDAAKTAATQTSVDDLPTNAELATALAGADDAVLAAIAALNNLSASQAFTAVLTTQLTESYAADGTAPTLAQAIMLIQQALTEFAISGTSLTVKKLDGSTTAAVMTLDSATAPTSTTRSA